MFEALVGKKMKENNGALVKAVYSQKNLDTIKEQKIRDPMDGKEKSFVMGIQEIIYFLQNLTKRFFYQKKNIYYI